MKKRALKLMRKGGQSSRPSIHVHVDNLSIVFGVDTPGGSGLSKPVMEPNEHGAIPTQSATSRFQILSLDGGGIKGIFSAAVLASLEADLGANIVDHFDLIAGTSTGGIIALGLGLGFKPRELVEFYVREGPNI